jgi:hypothetical protein
MLLQTAVWHPVKFNDSPSTSTSPLAAWSRWCNAMLHFRERLVLERHGGESFAPSESPYVRRSPASLIIDFGFSKKQMSIQGYPLTQKFDHSYGIDRIAECVFFRQIQ